MYKTEPYSNKKHSLPGNEEYYTRLKNLRKTKKEKDADAPNDVKLYNALEFVNIIKNNNLDNIGYFNQSRDVVCKGILSKWELANKQSDLESINK